MPSKTPLLPENKIFMGLVLNKGVTVHNESWSYSNIKRKNNQFQYFDAILETTGIKNRTYRCNTLFPAMKWEGLMTDSEIVKLYWARSEQAIGETKKKYGRLVDSVLHNICRDHSDAEECENDTYLTVWNRIPEARPEKLGAFVCAIARNIGLKRVEYWSADKRNPELVTALDEIQELVSGEATGDSPVEQLALRETLNTFLRGLKREERLFFLRRYWYFDGVKEIAKDFGVSEGRVKSSLFRTRKRLKQFLTEQGFTV
jgi:RNA polymerase sigma-70 factor (ECF subfamily)